MEGGSLSPWLSSLLQKEKVKIITKKSTLSFCAVENKTSPVRFYPSAFLFRSQLHVSFWLYFDSLMYVRTYVQGSCSCSSRGCDAARVQVPSCFGCSLYLLGERERQCRKSATRGDISQEVGTRGIVSAMRTARYVQDSADFLSNK